MPEKTLHMIGNAHIDPVWLWQWQEGFHEVKATFRSALDRMKEYEDFKFVSSSAVFYEWVEKSDPAMFAEIQARVKEGRWGIVGGWWLQPDCNIPSGESFVRQALYGQHYFKEKFGITAKVGYNVDSFGHAGMLPQILKKSGLDYYVFMRPMPHEMGLPGRIFWWQSDDGSKVLTFRIPFEYLTWGKEVDIHVQRCAAEAKAPFDEFMCFYGVGNHGGGPTIANIDSIHRLQKSEEGLKLVFSTPNAFFDSIAQKELPIPTVQQDLQHHASGCYAAHSGIKYWNRQAENRLIVAEKWSILANLLTGQPYPEDFKQAWKGVLFNQFHDILAGTSLEAAYDDARNLYGEALAIADRNLNYAVQALAWNVDIPLTENTRPFVVLNPHAWETTPNVEVEIGSLPQNAKLLDDNDQEIPMQMVQSQATTRGRYRMSFMATLPSMGYRLYRVVAGEEKTMESALIATETSLENEHLRLEIDPTTGFIQSLYDKAQQLNVFFGPAAKPVVVDDPSDTWGHDTLQFQNMIGAFEVERVYLVHHGAVKATLRVIAAYGRSRLVQDFSIYPGQKRVDVSVMVDWREQFKMLKLRFPVNQIFNRITYETAYGNIERPGNGEEEPGQGWIDVSGVSRDSGKLYGLSILNDGKYSFDVLDREIGLTVLRSPIYAHHIPKEPSPEEEYSFIDQGIQRFKYVLLPHEEGWEQVQAPRRTAELNQPPVSLHCTFHTGEQSQSQTLVSVDAPNVIVSAIKKAEENDDLILRCYETDKTAVSTVIRLPVMGREIEASFAPCEIKTFRVPRDAKQPVVETNLLEWAYEPTP
jgi:alpha-mannosidase